MCEQPLHTDNRIQRQHSNSGHIRLYRRPGKATGGRVETRASAEPRCHLPSVPEHLTVPPTRTRPGRAWGSEVHSLWGCRHA